MSLVAEGTVSMAGTYTANGIAVAAANAALDELGHDGEYERLDAISDDLRTGLDRVLRQAGLPAYTVGIGPLMQVWFAKKPIHNYRDAERYADQELFRLWWEGMLERGVLFHPSVYGICSYRPPIAGRMSQSRSPPPRKSPPPSRARPDPIAPRLLVAATPRKLRSDTQSPSTRSSLRRI